MWPGAQGSRGPGARQEAPGASADGVYVVDGGRVSKYILSKRSRAFRQEGTWCRVEGRRVWGGFKEQKYVGAHCLDDMIHEHGLCAQFL